jgi:hypothetical protein
MAGAGRGTTGLPPALSCTWRLALSHSLPTAPPSPQPGSAGSARSLCDPGLTAAGYTAGFARCTLQR